MPYATENDIRQQTFWQDFEAVPSAQILQCLQTAHQEILSETVLQDEQEVSALVVRAEVLLTVSHLYRMNAMAKAATARGVRTVGIQLDEWKQVSRLKALANETADEAWQLLRGVLKTPPPRRLVLASVNNCAVGA